MKIYGVLTKSDNAIEAESQGRFSASEIARQLCVPCGAVKALFPHSGEWHHVGKYANKVDYFNLGDCEEFIGDDHGHALVDNWKRDWKSAKLKLVIFSGLTISWEEFSGGFCHPNCHKYHDENAALIYTGGTFVEIVLPNGKILKKKWNGNHLHLSWGVETALRNKCQN